MKKLLIITDMYPNERNPIAGIFVRLQVLELSKLYDVRVLASHFPARPTCQKSLDEGIPLCYVQFPMSRRFFPLTVWHYRKHLIPRLIEILQDWQPDIIHVHDCRHIPELWALSPILKDYRGIKVLSVHNIKTLAERAGNLITRVFYAATLKRAYQTWDHVFFVNESLRERMQSVVSHSKSSNLGNALSPHQSVINPYSEDLKSWLKDDSYKIFSVGNLFPTKGFDLLLRAVKILSEEGRNLQLVIVGDGQERKSLLALRDTLKLDKTVRIDSAQPNSSVRSSYALFDSFVLPSYSESFGIVYLEALDAGLPIIGVKGQGMHGILTDGKHGLFCEPRDVQDICRNIRRLMDEPELASLTATHGRELVQKDYRMENLIRRITDIYEKY
ncbi:MAG: glycosyltransferase family 4 protein [Candidatus Cloacimonetes bacterium]|nr:glycosyltransferase family 4 protein [Candidatus Cloacimonadota bacterium]